LKIDQIKTVSQELGSVDSSSMRIATTRGILVCDFSLKRYKKDKREMEKQITKAEKLLTDNKVVTRAKFIKTEKSNQTLNTDLIEKTTLLLGIKGYYTNLTAETNETIINHYHNLWHVEKAFRIAKSDLATRPIYHFKRQAIEAHILICFIALAACKHMELKTAKSTKKIVKLLKSITDARIRNTLTGEIIVMRQKLPEEVEQLWKTLSKL
jgi:transposase